ncbi:MAG: PrsW family intramembrane metalloprotease [Eubacterium sp.]|nr:PrsW family intramembrane metalloprotease [Eubacterium sp.]
MENMIYILFICICIPLIVCTPLVQKSSRDIMIYLIIGIMAALFVSEINGILLKFFDRDMLFVTTTITPITEEIVKALPVLYYVFLFSKSRKKLLSISFALGIGFALFENTFILVQNVENVSLGWAVIRGFSTALMHGICTAAIGYGLSYISIRRKLSVPGTFALLITAIIYHGIFNMLVQSMDLKYCGFFLPIATYIPFLVYLLIKRKKEKR